MVKKSNNCELWVGNWRDRFVPLVGVSVKNTPGSLDANIRLLSHTNVTQIRNILKDLHKHTPSRWKFYLYRTHVRLCVQIVCVSFEKEREPRQARL
jgi:hypothetical protein